MNIREAVAAIIGEDLAREIIAAQGLQWAIVAALAEAKESSDPRALRAINAWNAQRHRERAGSWDTEQAARARGAH